jgi:hypothetical protein
MTDHHQGEPPCIHSDGGLSKIREFTGLPRTVDGDQAPADFTALGSPAGIDVR